jgi:hypothetical protein
VKFMMAINEEDGTIGQMDHTNQRMNSDSRVVRRSRSKNWWNGICAPPNGHDTEPGPPPCRSPLTRRGGFMYEVDLAPASRARLLSPF